jgi:beta-fructofuranosidase
VLELEHDWIWDLWFVRDGDTHHMFYLHAPRSLPHPDDRHLNVSIGHATSTDLRTWRVLPNALEPSEHPAFDDLATWTGSVIAHDGLWWLFYTGASRSTDGLVQSIGAATSTDLHSWTKLGNTPLVQADPRWYELLDRSAWHDQAWRDPWVLAHEGMFHMLVTARAASGDAPGRGVVGHATSTDLRHWTVMPPLTRGGDGFGHLEVTQVEVVDGVPILLFCCDTGSLDPSGRHAVGGVFSVAGEGVLGPFDVAEATRFPHHSLYAARLVHHDGRWWLLGFRGDENGTFVGSITDPIAVTASPRNGLVPL